jgi:tetratricopeptide (TPR) repeat protein
LAAVRGWRKQTALDSVSAGWAELADGRWDTARAAFEDAVSAAPTPEAFEGLSWSAWWLDDAEAVFSAREEAYRLYKESGDPASAARMATWLAADNLDFRGALSVARGWLRRAHRLLDPLELGADHGWLAFQEGYIANLGGDTDAARDLGERAAELGRRFGVVDLEMLGLAFQGAMLVAVPRWRTACAASTRPPQRPSLVRPRSRSRAPGPAVSS